MQPFFVSLDDVRVGTGATDAATEPLSTFLENRIDSNTDCLVANGSCVASFQPSGLINSQYSRGYASLIPTAIHVGAYHVEENTSSVNIKVSAIALNGSVEVYAEAYILRGGTFIKLNAAAQPLAVVFTSGIELYHELNLSLDPKEITSDIIIISVWMRSITVSAGIQFRTQNQITWTDVFRTSFDGFLENMSFNNFNFDNVVQDDTDGRTWQIVNRFEVIGKGGGLDGFWCGLQPLDGRPIEINSSKSGNSHSKRRISSLYPYSFFVSFERDPHKSTQTHIAKSQTTMLAQTPVLGQHTSQHGINIDAEHQVWRDQAVGNEIIQAVPNVTWFSAWAGISGFARPLWAYRSGSNVTFEGGFTPVGWRRFNSLQTMVEWNKTRIEVFGLLLGLEVDAIWTADNERVGYPVAPNDVESFRATGANDPRTFSGVQPSNGINRITANIPARITIKQLQNGDTSLATASYSHDFDFDITLPLWRTTPDYTRPLLRGQAFGWHENVFTESRFALRAQTNSAVDYFHQEGHIRNLNGHNDLQYLTPFSLTIDPPAGFDSTRPVVVEFLVDDTTLTNYYSNVSVPVTADLDSNGDPKFSAFRCKTALATWTVSTRGIVE